jgi:hypothetical protein
MHGYLIDAGILKSLKIIIGIFNHKMCIQGQICNFANTGNYEGAKCDVGHVMAVHNVKMKPVCSGFFNDLDLLREL